VVTGVTNSDLITFSQKITIISYSVSEAVVIVVATVGGGIVNIQLFYGVTEYWYMQ
jgi:hypothetical protein